MNDNLGISVIVDNHPRFFCEYVLWVLCAKDSLSIPKRVYFINNKHESLIRFSRKNGIDVKFADQLIPEAPHCNKLIPFLDEDKFENQIVSDTDLFFSRDVACFFSSDLVRLPPNNHASPPLSIFEKLYKFAKFNKTPELGTALFEGENSRETFKGNVSAGLIFIPKKLNYAAKLWYERAKWLSENKTILGRFANHVDQVSFAMMVHQHDIPFSHLPAQTNAILELLPQIQSVYGFHLTSGHLPNFKHFLNKDKTLNSDIINSSIRTDCEFINKRILKSIELLYKMPETSGFVENFLNSDWRRGEASSHI
ncbi:MAG: hypothetical protein L3J22_07240 [Xanthomonadales bacterium]|nr:hypothetical protein [Xanthomonadales bacterium]